MLIDVLRQARAIERIRPFRSPHVWAADQACREVYGVLREHVMREEQEADG